MIHDVDESIRELLDAQVVRGANIDIAFDLPDKEWAAKRQGPTINVFLYDVCEDLERRQVQFEPQYDADGIVTARQTPPRRFKLAYLVTTWAQRPEDEHRLLSATMDAFITSDEFPRQHLQGRAATVGAIRTTIALPLPEGRSLSDLWGGLGGMRPVLDLVITVPMGVRLDPHVGPPVLEGPKVSVLGPDGRPVGPIRRFTTPHQPPPSGPVPDGDTADVGGAAGPPDPTPPARSPRSPVTEEVIDAARFRRGSRVVELADDELAPGRRMGIRTMPRPDR